MTAAGPDTAFAAAAAETGVAGAALIATLSERRLMTVPDPKAVAYDLLTKDFMRLYDAYLHYDRERTDAAKIFLTLVIAPFLLMSLIKIEGLGTPSLSIIAFINKLPIFVGVIFVVVGFGVIVPFSKFIDSHCAMSRMARALNRYRLLYSIQLEQEFDVAKWHTDLDIDPNYPDPVRYPLDWASYLCLLMAIVGSLFISFGLVRSCDY